MSARRVVTAGQIGFTAVAMAAVALSAVLAPAATLLTVNLLAALIFFGVTVLRLVAAGVAARRKPPLQEIASDDRALPVYSVLVPMRDEARLVPGLVAALNGLDWPKDRLDIKFVLESEDAGTVAVAKGAVQECPQFELVIVPAVGPRTKPKALAYALPLCRGDFVTVYDAEDRPHPQQLREAYAVFSCSSERLACLQAPLVIDNQSPNWIARAFAVEYAALFDALLPTLASLGMPLPLGGTSNHFRRAALEASGGWDPFNVTEDADLGVRLARLGYRSGTLDLPTCEEAPTSLLPWINQRTRWFKGWMQTWLVHMRNPRRVARELGGGALLGFHLTSTGLIASSLAYPVYLVLLALAFTDPLRVWMSGHPLEAAVVGLNLFNLCAGYVAMAFLGARALRLRGRELDPLLLLLLPVYWLLSSLASYRAVLHLVTRPFAWDKTPHVPRRGSGRTPDR